jgi:dTDP-4-dehydrorhamnose 3,5-epimerase-like enzyme
MKAAPRQAEPQTLFQLGVMIVKGMAKVVLYDNREESRTRREVNEFFMGEQLFHVEVKSVE